MKEEKDKQAKEYWSSPPFLRKRNLSVVSYFAIILVAILALAMRFSIILTDVQLTGDSAKRYDPLAQNIIAGNGFSKASEPPYLADDFDQPGYAYFLAAIYFLSFGSKKAVVLVQLIMEIALIVIIVGMARRLGLPQYVQRLVLALGLICPFLPIFSGKILTEVPATFAITVTCYLLIHAVKQKKVIAWIYPGLGTGLSLLIRPDLIIAIVLMFLVAVFVCWYQSHRVPVYGLLIFTMIACVVLIPWTIRNYILFKSLRPLGGVTEQVHLAYVRWLDTWLDDPKYLHPYWWHALDPNSIDQFPSQKIPQDEAQKAEQALLLARAQASFEGSPSNDFTELALEAKQERPITTYLVVPIRRVFMTLIRMPTYVHATPLKVITYLYWLALLTCVVSGIGAAIKQKRIYLLIPGALIAGRLTLPLISALAVEPRYLIEALPAGFVLAAYGVAELKLEKLGVNFQRDSKRAEVVRRGLFINRFKA